MSDAMTLRALLEEAIRRSGNKLGLGVDWVEQAKAALAGSPAPNGQQCWEVYRTHHSEARARGLTQEAAHEVGLFAVYLLGKSAERARVCGECGGFKFGRLCLCGGRTSGTESP